MEGEGNFGKYLSSGSSNIQRTMGKLATTTSDSLNKAIYNKLHLRWQCYWSEKLKLLLELDGK